MKPVPHTRAHHYVNELNLVILEILTHCDKMNPVRWAMCGFIRQCLSLNELGSSVSYITAVSVCKRNVAL